MATALVSLAANAETTLVPAAAGRIVRLLRLIGDPNTNITIKSAATEISPTLKSGANTNVDIEWYSTPLACSRGEALVAQNHSVAATMAWIVYDIVD